MRRFDWLARIEQLDPAVDYEEIARITGTIEFPWDVNQALSFALFRTYAVPSIGRLLADTGEFTERVQKRYDDTALILDAVSEHGLGSAQGRDAVRRMNQMHGSYAISNGDMLYVLSTFVVTPIRWVDQFGWRKLVEKEKVAATNYYRELGRLMGMKDIPATYQEFGAYLDAYEAEHFAFDAGARAVADSTLQLFTTFPPNNYAPAALIKRFSYGLMDDPLRAAFRYPKLSKVEQAFSRRLVWLRGRFVRMLPPRREPKFARQLPNVRSYPNGYDIPALGTFPRGCPVPHAEAPAPEPARQEGVLPDVQRQ
ncbi:oxygenase MpaB family protein [Pseudonocardia sp. GCM10023141]|uniref:oxygenase MpaB family protein n=1 Tax=Pseudonocardia sp. GCM10023141 TaxID=3252653 RepID=UPI00360EDE92